MPIACHDVKQLGPSQSALSTLPGLLSRVHIGSGDAGGTSYKQLENGESNTEATLNTHASEENGCVPSSDSALFVQQSHIQQTIDNSGAQFDQPYEFKDSSTTTANMVTVTTEDHVAVHQSQHAEDSTQRNMAPISGQLEPFVEPGLQVRVVPNLSRTLAGRR
jgi:hypothetical protein